MIQVNNIQINPTIFPDKTSQVWKLDPSTLEGKKHDIYWWFESEGELMHLAQLVGLIVSHVPYSEINLHLPFLPYGRQDKKFSNDATFALRSFAFLINAMDFYNVYLTDPHSNVALELIKKSQATYITKVLSYLLENKDCLICFPDRGALNKYTEHLIFDQKYFYAEKIRDQATGNILGLEIVGNPNGRDVLIIDDICDGGRTFIELSKKLREAGAKSICLYVTHIINREVKQKLLDAGINAIYSKEGAL